MVVGSGPTEIRGESTKQYSRQTLVFLGGRCSRTSGWTPEARSRICVCRASFLMTLSRVECLPGSQHMISACSVTISVPAQPRHAEHDQLSRGACHPVFVRDCIA